MRIADLQRRALAALRRGIGDQRGGFVLLFALLAPVLILVMIGAIAVTQELMPRTHLQDATDAAALAVSATDAETPTTSEATLQTLATNYLAANFAATGGANGTPVITKFTLCTVNQSTDCGSQGVNNTVTISTRVKAPCWMPLILPGVCTSDGQSQWLTATNTTNVGLPSSIQWNFILDTSGSMIVGASPMDVQAIENWTAAGNNWSKVNDTSGTLPCAFACHDESSQSSVTSGASGSDMDQGVTNAHLATLPNGQTHADGTTQATTRYDVVLSATSEAIKYIQQQVTGNSQLAKNSYYFNLYWMSDQLNQAWSASAAQPNDWTDASAKVTRANLPVGLDTHIASALQPLTTSSWAGGVGNSYASPKKVVFLITDGLQSDFTSDFSPYGNALFNGSCGTGPSVSSAWSSQASGKSWQCNSASNPGWSGHYFPNDYATPISTSLCQQIKNNGITLAVLETPYVPLTGQSPNYPPVQINGSWYYPEFFPYEQFVEPVIYPNGPNTSSAVSAALQACASSPSLYFQASSTDPTTIQSGLHTLVNAFLATNPFLKQ